MLWSHLRSELFSTLAIIAVDVSTSCRSIVVPLYLGFLKQLLDGLRVKRHEMMLS